MLRLDPDMAPAPVVGIAETYEAFDVPVHIHRRAQLMHAISGTLSVSTASGSWFLPTNRALWIPAGFTHAITAVRTIALRTLYFDQAISWVPKVDRPGVIAVSPLLQELILQAVRAPWEYAEDSAPGRLARVLCDHLDLARAEDLYLPAPGDPRARKFTAFYAEDPADNRPLSVLSGMAGASTRTMERLFKAETGLSPKEWVQQFRLIKALEQISHHTPVGQAAFNVGFENPSSFIALFKRNFGTTPGKYAAQMAPDP